MNRTAFSLIELMIVLAVMAILMAMTVTMVTRKDTRRADVSTAADALAADLRKARAMAMSRHRTVGVAFHIQNGVGTSGKILNNKDGGHYYRILADPPAILGNGNYYKTADLFQFPDIIERIKDNWLTPPIQLAKGRVRFLALGDTDEGDYQCAKFGRTWASPEPFRDDNYYRGYTATWPRPWFGVFSNGKLHSWGGYDPNSAQNRWAAGFFYQGTPRTRYDASNPYGGVYANRPGWSPNSIFPKGVAAPAASGTNGWATSVDENLTTNPVITGSINSTDRTTWYYPAACQSVSVVSGTFTNPQSVPAVPTAMSEDPTNSAYCYVDGAFSRQRWLAMASGPRQVPYTLWKKGSPRPLVNSDWLDAVIVFTPDGSARFLEWNSYRRAYDWAPPYVDETVNPPEVRWQAPRGGVGDLAKPRGLDNFYASLIDTDTIGTDPEVRHYTKHTGGWFVTLAPDAEIVNGDARADFPDERAALRSINPSYRVFVSTFGDVTVIPVRQLGDDAVGNAAYWSSKVWPTAPSQWASAAEIRKNMPLGVLAPVSGALGPSTPGQLMGVRQPTTAGGRVAPITDIVTPRMLTDQIWWRNE